MQVPDNSRAPPVAPGVSASDARKRDGTTKPGEGRDSQTVGQGADRQAPRLIRRPRIRLQAAGGTHRNPVAIESVWQYSRLERAHSEAGSTLRKQETVTSGVRMAIKIDWYYHRAG